MMLKVTAAVIEKDGKILIAKRRKGDRMGGKWEFPGGKIKIGETPEDCLKRELREELGVEAAIDGRICSSRFTYLKVPLELLVYRASIISGTVVANDHDEIAWVEPADLERREFVKADLEVVKRLLEETGHAR